jgi:hypothetical protein
VRIPGEIGIDSIVRDRMSSESKNRYRSPTVLYCMSISHPLRTSSISFT